MGSSIRISFFLSASGRVPRCFVWVRQNFHTTPPEHRAYGLHASVACSARFPRPAEISGIRTRNGQKGEGVSRRPQNSSSRLRTSDHKRQMQTVLWWSPRSRLSAAAGRYPSGPSVFQRHLAHDGSSCQCKASPIAETALAMTFHNAAVGVRVKQHLAKRRMPTMGQCEGLHAGGDDGDQSVGHRPAYLPILRFEYTGECVRIFD